MLKARQHGGGESATVLSLRQLHVMLLGGAEVRIGILDPSIAPSASNNVIEGDVGVAEAVEYSGAHAAVIRLETLVTAQREVEVRQNGARHEAIAGHLAALKSTSVNIDRMV